jgi:ABC-2 type transport system permease protein
MPSTAVTAQIARVAGREFAAFFASPAAWLFLAAFLGVSLFLFFWVETFFARNIADVRPLFEWMPLLLVFLVAALTMRLWSEERRAGTLEMLLTLPVSPLILVLGKLLAAWALVALALLLTLPLPITVSLLGPLDWGPVVGGYLAALLLALAYIAMGLWVSARTDNPIVSLIGTAVLAGGFWLLGSDALTQLFGNRAGEWLSLLGTGSRFEAITRGVIDLRDLYYYLSLAGMFLALNVYTLERVRWAGGGQRATHRRWLLLTVLLVANLLAGNLWLAQLSGARADLTRGQLYTLSDTTRQYLAGLREPLTIRAYFSAQTHPLLAPLVPQLRDLLKEYELAGEGRVRLQVVDPQTDPEAEREAGELFGVKPVPFQVASKYQAAVVNSYFDIVVQYGDQFEKLGFEELIEVKLRGIDDIDVRLKNPEYDLTRTLKKVMYAYQAGGDLLAGLDQPVIFHGYISEGQGGALPPAVQELNDALRGAVDEIKTRAGDRFQVTFRDPDAGDGSLGRELAEKYGIKPLLLGLEGLDQIYFHILLEYDGRLELVPTPESVDQAGFRQAIEAGIKRFGGGLLHTVALYARQELSPFGVPRDGYTQLVERLSQNVSVKRTDLKSGQVPAEADLLLVVDPKQLDDKQRFAIDQFLMRGGTVIVAASPFTVDLTGQAGISASRMPTGLAEWLDGHGVGLGEQLVMDPVNTPFPVPVQRQIGSYVIQEVRNLPYPFFPDLREDGMADTGVTATLGQLTVTWPSPLRVDEAKQADRTMTPLLWSSPGSGLLEGADIQPDFRSYPETGFPPLGETASHTLALMLEGRFTSAFAGQPSPLLAGEPEAAEPTAGDEPPADPKEPPAPVVSAVIDVSPPSARLMLIGSGTLLSDAVLDLAAEATGTRYDKPLELLENMIDWSLEDRGLLALRGRGQYSRMLEPMGAGQQLFWEYLNYGLAVFGLLLVGVWRKLARRSRRQRHAALLGGEA